MIPYKRQEGVKVGAKGVKGDEKEGQKEFKVHIARNAPLRWLHNSCLLDGVDNSKGPLSAVHVQCNYLALRADQAPNV